MRNASHANIIGYKEVIPEISAIVMEYCACGNLNEFLKSQTKPIGLFVLVLLIIIRLASQNEICHSNMQRFGISTQL
jgi:hypothetical protein